MQIEPEELRQTYADMSAEELLSINRNDLTEVARPYYDAEVGRRGLGSASNTPPESGTNSADSVLGDLVVVETFVSPQDAELGLALLRSADIPAYLDNELSSHWTGLGGLRLMLPSAVLDQAKEILATQVSDDELIAQAEAAPADEDGIEQPD